MNLLQNIHTIWEASSALKAMIPTARVFTGRAPKGTLCPPAYASITSPQLSTDDKSNDSNYDIKEVRIAAWFESLKSAETFNALILDTYRDIDFDLENGAEALNLSLDTQNVLEEDDPTQKRWQAITNFNVLIRSLTA